MACNTKLTQNILDSCTDKPVKGLGEYAVIINFGDIDRSATTFSGATVTNLQLTAGSTGYKVEWYRELASTSTAYTPNADDYDGFSHSFLFRLPTTSAENAERAAELKAGNFVVVVPTKYGGVDGLDTYKVYGFDFGMRGIDIKNASNENSSILVTLSTPETGYENDIYKVLNEGSLSATTASFTSLFNPA